MTFDKQVKEAKQKRFENRILRDFIFIILGIIFLAISFFRAYKDDNKNTSNKPKTTTKEVIKKTTQK